MHYKEIAEYGLAYVLGLLTYLCARRVIYITRR
jgi:hypothetical protein